MKVHFFSILFLIFFLKISSPIAYGSTQTTRKRKRRAVVPKKKKGESLLHPGRRVFVIVV